MKKDKFGGNMKGVRLIPAGGSIVTVPGLSFHMCMISTRIKTHLPFRNNFMLYKELPITCSYCFTHL